MKKQMVNILDLQGGLSAVLYFSYCFTIAKLLRFSDGTRSQIPAGARRGRVAGAELYPDDSDLSYSKFVFQFYLVNPLAMLLVTGNEKQTSG